MAAFNRRDLKRLGIEEKKSEKAYIPKIRWNIRDVFFSIIFLVAILTGVYFLSAKIVSELNHGNQISITNITNTSFSVLYGIQVLLMVGTVWFFAIYWRRSSFRDLGLTYYSILRTVWYSFLALLLILAINFAYVFVMTSVFKIAPPENKIAELVENGNVSSTILLIVVSLIAPVCEELFFRGFIFQAFRQSLGVFAGLFISSLLFAAAHLEIYNFIPLMAIGWVLAYIFHKTKSLFPVIFLHSIYNLLMILVLFSQFKKIAA
ncbi:MAG TPA: CPBP family intramembrane metalloprotease [Actinobacteria bacterium]|jgi:membrane protease YdiL (CAAX protease family)|nr:CPBP family intramembrane metalloprotease [Actinomycetota bacterium]